MEARGILNEAASSRALDNSRPPLISPVNHRIRLNSRTKQEMQRLMLMRASNHFMRSTTLIAICEIKETVEKIVAFNIIVEHDRLIFALTVFCASHRYKRSLDYP